MRLSVIVPVRNDARRLSDCLASIRQDAGASTSTEVIVADNGSTDDSIITAERAGARVLSIPGLRVSAVRNAAAREATGDLLGFVDADHQLEPGWTAAAVDVMKDPAVGAAGARYLSPPDGTWVQQMYGVLRGRTTGTAETDWLGSGNMIVRRQAFDLVGGFDTSLEACEDVDLCRRLREAGFRIIADERLRSIHHGDPPTLGALFRAERWRGRDNLRVSLRGSLDLQTLPSIVIPLLSLAALATLIVTPVFGLSIGRFALWPAVVSIALLILLGAVRACRMALTLRRWDFVALSQAFAAAVVYDTARGLALVTRAPHHRR